MQRERSGMNTSMQRRATAGGGGSSSFLPADYVAQKVELRANILCLSLFGLVMFGVVAAFFVTNRQWLNVRAEQETITAQYTEQAQRIEQLKQLEEQKAEMVAKAEITTALIEKVPRSVLLAELVTRMPADITLLDLKLESKRIKDEPVMTPAAGAVPGAPGQPKVRTIAGAGPSVVAPAPGSKTPDTPANRVRPPRFEYKLTLQGVAKTNNDVADYLAGLNNCELLTRVELKHIKPREIDKIDLREFSIEAVIRPDADARSVEPVKELIQGTAAQTSAPKSGTASADPGKE